MTLHAVWIDNALHLFGFDAAHGMLANGELRAALGDSSADSLLASIAIQDTITLTMPDGQGGLAPKQVPALRLGPAEAVDFLTSLPAGAVASDSVRYWGVLSEFILEHIARQQFFPDVRSSSDGVTFTATWRLLVSTAGEVQQLEKFAGAMPPVCRAYEGATEPAIIVESFVIAATDAVIRRDIATDEFFLHFRHRTDLPAAPEIRWLGALLGDAPVIAGDPSENTLLVEQIRSWVKPLDHARATPPTQLRFTLEEPVDLEDTTAAERAELIRDEGGPAEALEGGPGDSTDAMRANDPYAWTLRFQLLPLEKNSTLIEAADLWSKETLATGVLSRNILEWRARLKQELARAAAACPLLERTVRYDEPTHLTLSTLEAHAFIHQWAAELREASFSVSLPEWAEGRGTTISDFGLLLALSPESELDDEDLDPTLARPTKDVSDPTVSQGAFGLSSLLSFDWRIAVGNGEGGQTTLTLDEFRSLAEKRTPLVRFKNRWLHIDPVQAQKALEFLASKDTSKMTLAQAFRTAYAAAGSAHDAGLPVLGLSGQGWLKDFLEQAPSKAMAHLKQPESFKGELRPYQLRGLDWLHFLHTLGIGSCLADDMGLGKAQPLDAKILTPTGWRRMGEIKVGDAVIGANGQPTRVKGVYPQGKKQVFRVTFSDGASTECCDEHLWYVTTPVRKFRGNEGRVMPLAQIRERLRDGAGNAMHFIPMVAPVAFDAVPGVKAHGLPLHPYVLGAILGDGGIAHRAILSSADKDLLDRVASLLPPGVALRSTGCGVDYRIAGDAPGCENSVIDALRRLELFGLRSHEKFVPHAYLLASAEDRLELLRGLLDTDGHVRPADNNVEYCTTSEQLAKDVQFLVHSLGGTAPIRTKPTSAKLAYRMSVAMPEGTNPFWLPRKADVYHPREKYPPTRAIVNVDAAGEKECQCIAVEAADQLYVTDDFIVTHNTIQMIAMMLHERETRNGSQAAAGESTNGEQANGANYLGPTLLFAPTSVVSNWQRELDRFAPSLRVLVHHGPLRLRNSAFVKAAEKHDVVLTSYALAHRDFEILSKPKWHRIALDEAQKIKNPSAASTIAIRKLPAPYKVALTGTPIENHLSELWSIMEVINPGLLGSAADFRERFAVPIEKMGDQAKANTLRKMIQPFVLRRTKNDPAIVGDLPDKIENRVYCTLTPEQAALYEATTGDMLTQIDAATGMRRKGLILAALTRLKQICDHPALATHEHEDMPIEKVPLDARSGKAERLLEMLEEMLDVPGDAALIFTQYRQMGMLLEQLLRARLNVPTLFLHGGVPAKKRTEMVEQFQADGSKFRIFLLSLRAGGLGLNLTAANHVFHFDRWWNPAVEAQATDRAHRIGQTRKVQVHKFICVGTLEERIDRLLADKRAVADRIVTTGDQWLTSLSTDELRGYLELSSDAVAEY